MREGESMKKWHLLKEGKKEEKIGPKKGRTERWNDVFGMFLVWLFVVVLCDVFLCEVLSCELGLFLCDVNGRISVFSGNGDKEAFPDSEQSI